MPNAAPIEPSSNGKRDFVLANTRLIAPPLTPEIRLRLADEAVPIWRKTEEELGAMGLPPPFWAFAWAGGQALARYALDHPALVEGKRALDFASGSGLVAIAAAKAGAAEITASDIDAFAVAAIAANAAENGVSIAPRLENLIGADENWEVVLAGDIAYEKDLARAAMDWLASLARRGATVLVGDPRRSYLPHDRLDCVIEYSVPVTRELEDFGDQADRRVSLSVTGAYIAAERSEPLVDAYVLDRRSVISIEECLRCALHILPSLRLRWRSRPSAIRRTMGRSGERWGQISALRQRNPAPLSGHIRTGVRLKQARAPATRAPSRPARSYRKMCPSRLNRAETAPPTSMVTASSLTHSRIASCGSSISRSKGAPACPPTRRGAAQSSRESRIDSPELPPPFVAYFVRYHSSQVCYRSNA